MARASRALATAARGRKTATSPCPPSPARGSAPPGTPIGPRPGSCPPPGGSTTTVLRRPRPGVAPGARAPAARPHPVLGSPQRAWPSLPCGTPPPPLGSPPACLPGASSAPWHLPNAQRRGASFPLTPTGHDEAYERLPALRHGLPPCPPCALAFPPWRQRLWRVLPTSPPRTARPSGPAHRAKAARTATASLRATAVGPTTASRVPVVTGTGPRASRLHRTRGSSTPWTTSSRGRHCLRTGTGPATLRPFRRPPQRLASQALVPAAAPARKRLATDTRFLGTALPGCPGGLPTWGRPLQDPPHLHSLVPGAGLAADRPPGRPARAHGLVPGTALSPISRARCKDDLRHAGVLASIAPEGWPLPWNVPRQATHHGHAAFPSLAPEVCRGALATRRLVSLTDRTVPCPSRHVGRARPRTTPLDVLELRRRFLPHVCPEGGRKVRHGGWLHARGALPRDPLRLLSMQAHPIERPPPPPPPRHRSRPAVRPGAHRGASSGVDGPAPATVSRPAERQDWARTIVVPHGVDHPRHPCARLPPSGGTRGLQAGAPPPARVPQRRLRAPRMPRLPLRCGARSPPSRDAIPSKAR
jgi:Putative transposase